MNWKPQAKQIEALTQTKFEVLFGGARGGGKTEAGLAWFLYDINNPRYRGLCIRKNATDLASWLDRAREFYAPVGGQVVGREIRFKWGPIIYTGHLKDENAYTKYQGTERQRILVEELTQIDKEENYEKLISCCRSSVKGLAPQVFCTANPGGKGHNWVKKRWSLSGRPTENVYTEVAPMRNRVFIPSRIEDNPILMENDPGYIHFLDSLNPTLRAAWKDGDWDIFSGRFFSDWKQDIHVIAPFNIPIHWRKYRSIDISGRHGWTACIWLAIDEQGRKYIYRDYMETGKDAKEHAEEITKLSKDEKYVFTVIDNSAFADNGHTKTIADEYQEGGVKDLVACSKSRVTGWNEMNTKMRPYLGINGFESNLVWFRTCTKSIETIPALVVDEDNIEDLDTDSMDHIADCVRYLLVYLADNTKTKPEKTAAELRLEKLKAMQKAMRR